MKRSNTKGTLMLKLRPKIRVLLKVDESAPYRFEYVTTSLDHVLTKLRIMISREIMLRLCCV